MTVHSPERVGEGRSSERVGTKKDILSVVKVSDETLRIRLAEFESTAASFFLCRVSRVGSLTIEEFNKLADQTNDFARRWATTASCPRTLPPSCATA